MTTKEGLAGSGIYDQKGNVEIHSMILWMWVPIDVSMDHQEQSCTNQRESSVVRREGAPNSPDAAQPILITMGKEDKKLLDIIQPPVHADWSGN